LLQVFFDDLAQEIADFVLASVVAGRSVGGGIHESDFRRCGHDFDGVCLPNDGQALHNPAAAVRSIAKGDNAAYFLQESAWMPC
ncbi:MAG: hypothetical protein RIS04_1476, partial [Pseudomonadota bacterium]